MNEIQNEILQLVKMYCQDGRELDLADMVSLSTSLKMMEVLEAIPILEQAGYIEVIEIDMCCGADYIVTGLTKKGEILFKKMNP